MAEPVPVVHIANFATRAGGGEESLLTLVRALHRRRFAPHVVVPGDGDLADELRRSTIPVTVLELPPVRPWTGVAVLRAVGGLRALLAACRVRLVHAHGSRGALYGGLAAHRLGVPVIWHARIADRDPLLDGVLLRLSTRVIAISRAVKARFDGSRFVDRVRVVYNGIDSERWAPATAASSHGPGPIVLLVGRLMEGKGQTTLLRAAPTVLERFPAARFVLLGPDSDGEGARLRELARRLGVDTALTIRDWMADPRAVFEEADVVVLPSRSEGFGRVLVEAAFMAKPVVASRVGGIPEVVVDGETGLLIGPEDVPGLADALIALLGDGALRARLGTAARRRALERFTLNQHVAGVEAVYAELLGAAS